MAITRTAKGTVASKTSGPTLTLSSVSMTAGGLLIVGLAYETDAAIVSVKYGSRKMKLVASSGVTQGDTRVRQYRSKVRRNKTADIVVTWASAMTARAMFATALSEVGKKDVGQTNSQTGTGSPATGTAATSTVADTISIAAFASIGPSGDTPGSAGVGHTLGQRVGTTGAPPASNVTIQETYEILSATGNIRATLSGATSRDWASTITAFAASHTYTVGRVYYCPNDGNPGTEAVQFVLEDETSTAIFETSIPRADFELMTDQEVSDCLAGDCGWWDGKVRDNDPSPNFTPDAAFNTRMASFVDDEIIV